MSKEDELRGQIDKLVDELYACQTARKDPFHPGSGGVPYAGRVYDARELKAGVRSVLDFWLTLGPEGEAFERGLARYVGQRFSVLVNSGSSANLLALASLTSPLLKDRRLRPGEEVITVAAGFPTTVNPILLYGCVPVFVDIDPVTRNIRADMLEQARSSQTRAVMVAHTLGNPVDIDTIQSFCRKHDLYFIEDNCDALGSLYRGKKTGSFGDLATQSFYPPHHITMGEGGAVLTSNGKIKQALASLRDWGRDCWCDSGKDNTCGQRFDGQHGSLPSGYDHKYVYSHTGYNLKPLDIQAAIGRVQLNRVDEFGQARRKNFQTLHQALRPFEHFLQLPRATEESDPSWFGFLMTVKETAPFGRNDIVRYLEQKKIQTRMLFGGNLIRQPYFQSYQNGRHFRTVGSLEETDRVMEHGFWIGVYPGLTELQMEYVLDSLTTFLSGGGKG